MTDYDQTRRAVLIAAREGRATLLPAGARDNATALILVDGEVVGEAVAVGHFVREEGNDTTFGLRTLAPAPAFTLPTDLRE